MNTETQKLGLYGEESSEEPEWSFGEGDHLVTKRYAFIYSVSKSLNQHLLSTYYLSNDVPGARDVLVLKWPSIMSKILLQQVGM